jgi:hypothetical protein
MSYVHYYFLEGGHGQEESWSLHPLVVTLMRPMLENTAPTENHYSVDGEVMKIEHPGGRGSQGLPEVVRAAGEDGRRKEVTSRVCDEAAVMISEMVVGAPGYHPLLKDADKRLADLKAYIDLYGQQLRTLSYPE